MIFYVSAVEITVLNIQCNRLFTREISDMLSLNQDSCILVSTWTVLLENWMSSR